MSARNQDGQAVVEALVVLTALGSMWVAIGWLGQLQDIRQQMAHVSRHAAFAWAHQEMNQPAIVARAQNDLNAQDSPWRDRQVKHRFSSVLALRIEPGAEGQSFRIGDPHPKADALRTQWQLGENRVWTARAELATGQSRPAGQAMHHFDLRLLALSQHTAILRGHGAANGDSAVQAILASSDTGWRSMQQASERAGRSVTSRVAAMDAAWGRATPLWDWLSSWQGQVPPRYLEHQP